jgi:hypothetical protein
MELLLLMSAYLVGATALGIAAGAWIARRRDVWVPVRPGRELTARGSQPPNVGSCR